MARMLLNLKSVTAAVASIAAGLAKQASSATVSRLSVTSFAVEGGTEVEVFGSGFGAAGAAGAQCRITGHALGDWASADFTFSGPNPATPRPDPENPSNMYPAESVVTFNATVISDTRLLCTTPAVTVNGRGRLNVHGSGNGSNWSTSADAIPVEYTQLFDVALGRRPYVSERTGHLLVRCNTSLIGMRVTVEATFPDLPTNHAGWHWDNISLGAQNILELSLLDPTLPPKMNTDLRIVIRWVDQTGTRHVVTKWRRFMRAPLAPVPGVVPSQVDHSRRGLLVGGEQFLGVGWFFHTGTIEGSGNFSQILTALARQATLGDNQLMPLSFFALEAREQREFLDTCESLGMKVMIPVDWDADGQYEPFSTDPTAHAWLVGNITALMNHSAVLGWYICESHDLRFLPVPVCHPPYQLILHACMYV